MCTVFEEIASEGRAEGRAEAITEGIQALIETCQELNISKEITFEKLIDKFSLNTPTAEAYIEKYWKE